MSKVTVELEWEAVDAIVVQQLRDARDGFIEDIERRKDGSNTAGIFHKDVKKDIKELEKHIKSFNRAIRYFSVSGE